MGAGNLVSGLQNWLYLKKEQMELTDFLQAGTNLFKLKSDWTFLGCVGSEMGVVSLVMGL